MRDHWSSPTLSRSAVLTSLVALALAGSIGFALLTPPGQPYDEPAHWNNVTFYAEHGRMPVIGEPGSSYEAQMGPVYYALSAMVGSLFGAAGSEEAFHGVRLFWTLLTPVLVLLGLALARALRASEPVAWAATALIALNPLLLGISGSVQNDHLTITLCALALVLAARTQASGRGGLAHLAIGVVIGAAVLTKVVAVSLLPAVLIAVLVRPGLVRRRWARASAVLVGAVVTSGWWFVRNLSLYGDLTGGSAVQSAGFGFAPMPVDSVSAWVARASEITSYLFVPVEYYRNSLRAPLPIKALAVLSLALCGAVVGAVLVARLRGRREAGAVRVARPDLVLPVAAVASALLFYLLQSVLIFQVSIRLVFVAAPPAAVLLALAMSRLRWGAAVLVVILVTSGAAATWLLSALPDLPEQAFMLFT